ncbi:MAG: hypothetical protein ACOC9O_01815 [Myxococcota bacterium]
MTRPTDSEADRAAWRLWPSERVRWQGRATPRVPRERVWLLLPALVFAFAAVAGLFAALVALAGLDGAGELTTVAAYMTVFGLALVLLPRYLLDGAEYMITDRRVLWRRGRLRRSMDRHAITFGRIRWHRSVPGLGTLELVRAVPFGPLARQQRLVLADVPEPDRVFSFVRGVAPSPRAGDGEVPVHDRLDPDERVLWGGQPQGWLLGWREVLIGALGLVVLGIGMLRGHRLVQVLIGLEDAGLAVGSWEWALLFSASALAWTIMVTVGGGLAWYGLVRARRLGQSTDYLLTDRRLLIRRGRTELSLDRRRIVDVAETKVPGGLHHLFLVLDAPDSRALSVSGALGPIAPPRDQVPPVLFELQDAEWVRGLILHRDRGPPMARFSDAA